MIGTIVTGALAGIMAAAGWAGVKWVSASDNRVRFRQALCRHRWEEIDWHVDDPAVVFISPYTQRCPKCGARR
jgi:hypothetical protein